MAEKKDIPTEWKWGATQEDETEWKHNPEHQTYSLHLKQRLLNYNICVISRLCVDSWAWTQKSKQFLSAGFRLH